MNGCDHLNKKRSGNQVCNIYNNIMVRNDHAKVVIVLTTGEKTLSCKITIVGRLIAESFYCCRSSLPFYHPITDAVCHSTIPSDAVYRSTILSQKLFVVLLLCSRCYSSFSDQLISKLSIRTSTSMIHVTTKVNKRVSREERYK